MPTEPRVTGTPICSTRRRISRRLWGTSVPRWPLRLRRSQRVSTARPVAAPTVTPEMAPAAHRPGSDPCRTSSQATVRPTVSLQADSMIWLTAVGSILPRPWV